MLVGGRQLVYYVSQRVRGLRLDRLDRTTNVRTEHRPLPCLSISHGGTQSAGTVLVQQARVGYLEQRQGFSAVAVAGCTDDRIYLQPRRNLLLKGRSKDVYLFRPKPPSLRTAGF